MQQLKSILSPSLFVAAALATGCVAPAPEGGAAQPRTASDSTPARRSTTAARPGTAAAAAQRPPLETVPFKPHDANTGNVYVDRFLTMWNDMHNPSNGYFSPEGVPYHMVETLDVEGPDYGHETTSEAYSYYIWLEAQYGMFAKDYSYLRRAWANMERYIIPGAEDQPNILSYKEMAPAQFAPEADLPSGYPSMLDPTVKVGFDPIGKELRSTYGQDTPLYAMHWIMDVDNWYGFGNRNDGTSRVAYINTYQRGSQESSWETITQPCWDEWKFGGKYGYLDLFVAQKGKPAKQWKYSNAPDADMRAIEAAYWAKVWSDKDGGNNPDVAETLKKAAKLGDFMRYSFFDKYFKTLGCKSPTCPAAQGYESSHYLVNWYFAWGGSVSRQGAWGFRIGSSSAHFGYQNPLASWALANVPEMKPLSPNAVRDWEISTKRQIEFYRWLQSAEGAFAGGATNSWNGRYENPPSNLTSFYGMTYDWQPVYHDPPSNEWFGMQAWSVDRLAQYYYVTDDPKAKLVLDRWVAFVKANSKFKPDGSFALPVTLEWSGEPSMNWNAGAQNWKADDKGFNSKLHGKAKDMGVDTGIAAALSRAMAFYAAKSGDKVAQKVAKAINDRLWAKYRTNKGVSAPEMRKDYRRFNDPVYVPASWKGKMPNGDAIDSNSTFLGIRSKYRSDPEWGKVQAYLNGGQAPVFTYHRFWAQSDVALANATYGWLFPDDKAAGKYEKATAAVEEKEEPVQAIGKTISKKKGKGKGGKKK